MGVTLVYISHCLNVIMNEVQLIIVDLGVAAVCGIQQRPGAQDIRDTLTGKEQRGSVAYHRQGEWPSICVWVGVCGDFCIGGAVGRHVSVYWTVVSAVYCISFN